MLTKMLKRSRPLSERLYTLASEYFNNSGWFAYLMLCIMYLTVNILWFEWIANEELVASTLQYQVSSDQLAEYMSYQYKEALYNYVSVPFVVGGNALFVALAVSIGLLWMDIKFSFGQLFALTLNALGILIAYKLFQYMGYALTEGATLWDILRSDFLSIVGYLPMKDIPQWAFYPLHHFSLPYLAFLLLFPLGLSIRLGIPYGKSARAFCIGYGSATLLLILIVAYVNVAVSWVIVVPIKGL